VRPEVRGFAFGLSLGLAALAGFGAASLQPNAPRFQISAASGSSGSYRVYVVDTFDGTVWQHGGRGAFDEVGNVTKAAK
jgi:hypothetical protein